MLTVGQANARDAFMQFLLNKDEREFLLLGHSGCGKTYLTKDLIEKAIDQSKFLSHLMGQEGELNIFLTATTNQAAENLNNATGMPAGTIHSFLGLRVDNDWKTGKTVLKKTSSWGIHYNTLIIVDEASMADSALLQHIREGTVGCKILYILDPNQLLPVFENKVPVLNSTGTVAVLDETVRQQAGNPIIALGAQLRNAIQFGHPFPDIQTTGTNIIQLEPKEFQAKIDELFLAPGHTSHKAKILAWTNKRVNKYNTYVRSLSHADEAITVGETLVANTAIIGNNRIPVISNQQEVLVTEVEEPTMIDGVLGQWIVLNESYSVFRALNQNDAEFQIKAASKLKNWPEYFRLKEFFADLRPVHASTVHKSQGSTYDSVFIDLTDICSCNQREEVLRMLYVAFTRARFNVYFRGQIPAKYLGSTP